jgi:hypothetical protein
MFEKPSESSKQSNVLISVPSLQRTVDRDDKNVVLYDVK